VLLLLVHLILSSGLLLVVAEWRILLTPNLLLVIEPLAALHHMRLQHMLLRLAWMERVLIVSVSRLENEIVTIGM
jgi:ABC-type molybdate transport system ATPase subunit